MIKENVERIKKELKGQTIVAATKYASIEQMRELRSSGISNFAENKVDSLLSKKPYFQDVVWHFIGHLQTNKCKSVINEIEYLHSLDSLKLAGLIQKYRKNELKCFIQVNISGDEHKSGIDVEDVEFFLTEVRKFDKIKVIGFMTILKQGLSKEENLAYFKALFDLKEKYNLSYLSMGMSTDYKEAIEAGSNYLRLGSILLGEI